MNSLQPILRLKCTKFNFDWGSALDPAGELTSVVTVLKILRAVGFGQIREEKPRFRIRFLDESIINLCDCLLYTSDAADE